MKRTKIICGFLLVIIGFGLLDSLLMGSAQKRNATYGKESSTIPQSQYFEDFGYTNGATYGISHFFGSYQSSYGATFLSYSLFQGSMPTYPTNTEFKNIIASSDGQTLTLKPSIRNILEDGNVDFNGMKAWSDSTYTDNEFRMIIGNQDLISNLYTTDPAVDFCLRDALDFNYIRIAIDQKNYLDGAGNLYFLIDMTYSIDSESYEYDRSQMRFICNMEAHSRDFINTRWVDEQYHFAVRFTYLDTQGVERITNWKENYIPYNYYRTSYDLFKYFDSSSGYDDIKSNILLSRLGTNLKMEVKGLGTTEDWDKLFNIYGIYFEIPRPNVFELNCEMNYELGLGNIGEITESIKAMGDYLSLDMFQVDINGNNIGTTNEFFAKVQIWSFRNQAWNDFLSFNQGGGFTDLTWYLDNDLKTVKIRIYGYGFQENGFRKTNTEVIIDKLTVRFEASIRSNAYSSYNIDIDNTDSINWVINFSVRSLFINGWKRPNIMQLNDVPNNYEFLSASYVQNGIENLIPSANIQYEPMKKLVDQYPLDIDAYRFSDAKRDCSVINVDTLLQGLDFTAPITISIRFKSQNAILSHDYYGYAEGKKYYTDKLNANELTIIELGYNNTLDYISFSVDYATNVLNSTIEYKNPSYVQYNLSSDTIGKIDWDKYKVSVYNPLNNGSTDQYFSALWRDHELKPSQIGFIDNYRINNIYATNFINKSFSFDMTYFYFDAIAKGTSSTGKMSLSIMQIDDFSNTDYFFNYNSEHKLIAYRMETSTAYGIKIRNLTADGLSIDPYGDGTSSSKYLEIGLINNDTNSYDFQLEIAFIPISSNQYYIGKTMLDISMSGNSEKTIQFDANLYEGGNMPKLYGIYKIMFSSYQSDTLLYRQYTDDPYFFISSRNGKLLNQVLLDTSQDSYALNYDLLKATYADIDKIIINYWDDNMVCFSDEYEFHIGGNHNPNIDTLLTPSSVVRDNVPFDIKTTITDEDADIVNRTYRIKFWLSPEYRNSPLDTYNNGLYESDWHNCSQFSGDIWGISFTQAQLDSQIALNFMQIIPSSIDYAIDFKVIDQYYNQDLKTLHFQYNPLIKLTAYEGNITFPNLNPPQLWALCTWANFSTNRNNVKTNDIISAIMDIHSSMLYVPRRFEITLPLEYSDAQNYRTYQRYRYSGSYFNKTSIAYEEYRNIGGDGRVSTWSFPLFNHYPVTKLLFDYETPRLSQEPYTIELMPSGGERVTIPITITSKHNFTNVQAKVSTMLFRSNYNWKFYLRLGLNYVEQDLEAWNFTTSTSSVSPTLYFNLTSIGKGDTYIIRIIGEEIFVAGMDTTPFWLALILPFSFMFVPWLLFYYRSPEYAQDLSWYKRFGSKGFYGIWVGIFAGSYALGVILWSLL